MKSKKIIKDSKFNIKLCGISLHEIIWYFTLFSIAGLLLETIYCYQTTGIIESRKGLVWGPFCPIYGIGATFLIIYLNKYKDHPLKLFLYGVLVGSILEYFMSFALEAVYGTRFWDYSYLKLNLNGRISLIYSLFWGILAIFLMRFLKPFFDQFINNILNIATVSIELALLLFLVFDSIATVYSLSIYKERAIAKYYNIPENPCGKIESIVNNKIFSDKYMKKSFPNLRFIDNSGKEIFIRDIIN